MNGGELFHTLSARVKKSSTERMDGVKEQKKRDGEG